MAAAPAAKILMVDDESDLEALIVQKFRRQIREGKVNFLFAHDGIEALAMLEAAPDIDMVVTDINMPRMDGLTLLGKLQELESQFSTIIVSAYGDMANIRTAMNKGAFDFLTKPVDFTDLETTIGKTLRHVTSVRNALRRQAEAEAAHAALSRYFSPNLALRLAHADGIAELAAQRREVAAIFTDIAGFTSLAETLPPEQLTPLLNEYFGGMTEIVFRHEGTVAKIIGDALHVLFGAPADQPDHAARAVACALDLDAFAEEFRQRWNARGVALGLTRIGIHAGPAIVGNFGSGRFFEYTAYGDTINTAARLEAVNKQLGTRICASAVIAERTPGFLGRPIGDLKLRGRGTPLRAFEPLTQPAHAHAATAAYADAFARLEARDAGAMPAFAAIVGMRPGDLLVNFHLRRLLEGQNGVMVEME